eukprot:scaffold1650_cov124-Isochrysis_galbana.AAC.3
MTGSGSSPPASSKAFLSAGRTCTYARSETRPRPRRSTAPLRAAAGRPSPWHGPGGRPSCRRRSARPPRHGSATKGWVRGVNRQRGLGLASALGVASSRGGQ